MTAAAKLRVDMAEVTLGELADVADLLGMSLSDALTGPGQPRALAALAWIVTRRTDSAFTFDDALKLRMADIDMVNSDAEGEALAAANGGERASSLASGG